MTLLRDQISNKTQFREAERYFKRRNPPASYEDAIDLDNIIQNDDITHYTISADKPSLKHNTTSNKLQVFQFKSQPGMTVIKNALSPSCQRLLVMKAMSEYTAKNVTNLDIHYNLQIGVFQQLLDEHKGSEVKINPHTKDVSQSVGYEITALSDPTPKLPSLLIQKLRWCSLGLQYNWFTKLYEQQSEAVPIDEYLQGLSFNFIQLLAPRLRICHGAVGAGGDMEDDKPEVYAQRRKARNNVQAVTAESMQIQDKLLYTDSWCLDRASLWKAEAGIVNFYNYKDSLTAHVDRSELNLEAPLISYSLGNSCVFLISCSGVNTKPLALILKSGDVLVMSAEARRAHHGVPRIMENTCPEYLYINQGELLEDQIISEYIKKARININLRQVFYP